MMAVKYDLFVFIRQLARPAHDLSQRRKLGGRDLRRAMCRRLAHVDQAEPLSRVESGFHLLDSYHSVIRHYFHSDLFDSARIRSITEVRRSTSCLASAI